MIFAASSPRATGRLYLPGENELHALVAEKSGGTYTFESDPIASVTRTIVTK